MSAVLRAKNGMADELASALGDAARARTEEPGNVAFIVSRSLDDPDEFHFCEVYADPAAHREHRRLVRLPDDPHSRRIALLSKSPPQVSRGEIVFGAAEFNGVAPAPNR